MAFKAPSTEGSAFGDADELEETVAFSTDTRESMYVSLFQEMVDTVLSHEIHLFSQAELAVFQAFKDLSYHARYLLIRLVLRKQGCWFRQCKLEEKYATELGPKTLEAMTELWSAVIPECPPMSTAASCSKAGDSDAGSIYISRFASGDDEATLDELLDCLALEEVKTLAKDNQVWKAGMTLRQLRDALRKHTSTQSTLPFQIISSKNKSLPMQGGSKMTVKDQRLRSQLLKLSSRCIRINQDVRRLLNRVNMVYLRCTNPVEVESLLLPCVLNRTRRRRYPDYEYSRTTTIFPTRLSMLTYEEALMLEGELDIIYGGGMPQRSKRPKDGGTENNRFARSRKIRDLWEEQWEPWKRLVAEYEDQPLRLHGLERFEAGYILTRIMYKGADALGALGEYELEIEVLQALLEQQRWRRGSRGAWWERLALIHHKHLDGSTANIREAMKIVLAGLEDPLTHMKYRPTLERRLQALENRLKVPKAKRFKEMNKQKKHKDRCIGGERIYEILDQESNERDRRALQDKRQTSTPISTEEREKKQTELKRKALIDASIRKGKSVWKGKGGEELTVEEFSLQFYETLGYKGVHAEGRAVGTLFSLLFWDILFTTVPGAFETAYQTAPLDLWEDSFYISRKDDIERRLKEIEAGEAWDIIKRVEEQERTKQTWCIGLKWDLFTSDDLMRVAQGFEGKVLSNLCRLLAEDYSLGTAGVPDLFLWNPEKKMNMFAEVKGPGDSLQENQKVWIDLLVRAGVEVELCKVVEEEDLEEELGDQGADQRAETKTVTEVTKVEVIVIESEDEPDVPATANKAAPKRTLKRSSDTMEEVDGVAVYSHQLGPKSRKPKKAAFYKPGTM